MEPNHDKIADQWLEGALKQYGKAEPRTGLEGRILANLRAEKLHVTERKKWLPALAGFAVMLGAGLLVFFGIGHHGVKKEIAKLQAPGIGQRQNSTPPDRRLASLVLSPDRVQRKPSPRRQPVQAAEVAEPRLEQFPAPRPLSEQEKMLARYVEERPQEAKQVGLAQAALLKKDLVEFEKEYGPLDHPNSYSQ